MLMGARGMLDRVVYCSRTTRTSFSAIPTELSPRYILLVEALVNKFKKNFQRAHIKLVHLCSVIDCRSHCRLSTMLLQKVARVKIRQKFQIPFRRMQIDKQNHATEVSQGWSLHRISTTDSKVRSALQNSTIHLSEQLS